MKNNIMFFLWLLLLPQLGISVPKPVFQFDALYETSDVVCVCTCEKVDKGDTRPQKFGRTEVICREFVARCHALSVFKGTISTQFDIRFFQGESHILGLGSISTGTTSVVFMRKENEDKYVFTDGWNPVIPLADYYSKIDITHLDGKTRIKNQLLAALKSSNPESVITSLRWLGNLNMRLDKDVLIELTERSDTRIQILALSLLMKQRDAAAVRRAGEILLGKEPGLHLSKGQSETLAWALEEAAETVPVRVANQLAASSNPTIKKVGVLILKTVGDESSLPVLIAALDAENSDTQCSAVVALARITGRKGPSWQEFNQSSDAEIAKWKTWWTSKKNQGGNGGQTAK